MNIPLLSAFFETSLASSMSAAATTFTLVSGTDRDGNTLSGLYGFVIDPDTADREYILATMSGTSGTIVYRGLDADAPNTEISGNKKTHRRGSVVKISDYPLLGILRNILNGDDTIPNKISYTSHPGSWTSGSTELVTVKKLEDTAIAGAADSSTTVKGITKVSVAPTSASNPIAVGDNDPRIPTQDENDAIAGNSGTAVSGSNKLMDAADAATTSTANKVVRALGTGKIDTSWVSVKFGGTGADGALSSSSGTTTLDAAGAKILVKNYTSISLTGTAKITVSNPHAGGTILVLRSQGNVTLTSSVTVIDLKGLGATSATDPNYLLGTNSPKGITSTGATGGAAGAAYDQADKYAVDSAAALYRRTLNIATGAGGGTGMTRDGAGGAGGRGGGALLIECGGAFNFTTGVIDVSGNAGSNGAAGDDSGGGGGGGSCGMALVLYTTLTANSGTFTATGGAGGSSGTSTDSGANAAAGGGGGAGSYVAAGGAGGTSNNNGSAAAGLGAGGGGGGSGGTSGTSPYTGGAAGGNASATVCLVTPNIYF